jgi:transcriptional regulator with XRE-family HTH domain
MVRKNDYPELRPVSVAFAREYKGFMAAEGITQSQIADALNRNQGYVSERVSGKRALDTDDVDALAGIAGWNGRELLIELAKRSRPTLSAVPALPVDRDADVGGAPQAVDLHTVDLRNEQLAATTDDTTIDPNRGG